MPYDIGRGRIGGGRGEILIDNRYGDTALVVGRDGPEPNIVRPEQTFETRTMTCGHCQAVVLLNPQRTRPRGWCSKCNHYCCDSPGCNSGVCTTVWRMVELQAKYPQLDVLTRDANGHVTPTVQALIDRHTIHASAPGSIEPTPEPTPSVLQAATPPQSD